MSLLSSPSGSAPGRCQVRHQFVSRRHDVHLRGVHGPVQQEVGCVERRPDPGGLGLEEPPRRLPQRRSFEFGCVDDYPGIHAADGNCGC